MQKQAYLEMYQYEDLQWWFVARRAILKKILNHYVANKPSCKILELGCGTGGNFSLLAQYGKLYAMEYDAKATQLAQSRNIGNVIQGVLPAPIAFTGSFDLICMLDVLEHIDDELATLTQVNHKLINQGKLLLTVPAYQFLWGAHDVAVNHKRRYTKKQLIKTIEQAGFKVLYASYFNTLLFPVIAIVRFLNKWRGKKQGTDVSMPPAFINKLLTLLFASEHLLIPQVSLPFGVSILIMAEKL